MHSIELVLDDQLDAAVRGEWRMLSEAGLPSQADHRGASNRPHVTVSTADALPLDGPVDLLPLPITVGSLVLFGAGTRRTLARLVLPTSELLALRDGPGWTPHVTLARRLPVEDIPTALAALDGRGDLHGEAVGLRHWDGTRKIVTPLR